MTHRESGFTLIEMLVATLLAAVVAGAALTALTMGSRTYANQNLTVAMEQNLRVGMQSITDVLRATGYGVPTPVGAWFPWVTGFTDNPKVGANQFQVARCTAMPVVTVSAAAAMGSTSLSVDSAVSGESVIELLNAGDKRLIFIGDAQSAHVTNATASTINIDTDAQTVGAQGTSRAFAPGTPICRVDVLTFKIETDPGTGIPQLTLDENQGDGPIALAEGITTLTVTPVTPLKQYTVALTGRTEGSDPMMGRILTRTLFSNVTLRNAL